MTAVPPPERFEAFTDPVDGTRWEVDLGFLTSGWRCIWGDGCLGILDRPAAELGQGCCSVGAELLDEDEARRIGALGLTLDPERFQFAAEAADGGIFAAESPTKGRATRVVDDACIFFNRPGFEGGTGCALHLAAIDEGESPIDWKPSICWQSPLKVDDGPEGVRRLRRWHHADWGDDELAWCCADDRTAEADAYGTDDPATDGRVLDTMAEELTALVGTEVMVELRRRTAQPKP